MIEQMTVSLLTSVKQVHLKQQQHQISNMKFVIVVVLFALAMGAQSSIVGLPLAYTSVNGPVVIAGHPPAAIAIHAAVHAAPVHVVSVPAVVAVAPVEGTYVAKTRGAVHIAPLPGHANSASSVNLEPAPGTA